jgi:hypothetical protein
MAEIETLHSVVWWLDHDTVWGQLLCSAPEGSNCRLICDKGCESWPCGCEGHELVDYGKCNAAEWITDCGSLEEMYSGKDLRPLKDGPVEVTWEGDYYSWRYVDDFLPRTDDG